MTARTWWVLAGLAAAVSLGLGWDWYYHPYYGSQLVFTPGSSIVLADGTVGAGGLTQGSAIFLVGMACAALALRAAGLLGAATAGGGRSEIAERV